MPGPQPDGCAPFLVGFVGRGLDPAAAARGLAALRTLVHVVGRGGIHPSRAPAGAASYMVYSVGVGVLDDPAAFRRRKPPRRPVGRPPYNPRKACAAMRGVGDAAPYKVRRAVGAGHARPAASRNRPFTVDPRGGASCLPRRVARAPQQKPRQAPRPARSFFILKNVTPFSRRSAFSARPESRPAAPPAWGRRGRQAPPRRAPHACPSPSACS